MHRTTLISKTFSVSLQAKLLALLLLLSCSAVFFSSQAQDLQNLNMSRDGQGRLTGANSKMKGGDSLQQRDNNEDSITIYYRMFDSSRIHFIDSTVGDYTARYPMPMSNLYLGNIGNATKSVLFKPYIKPGFDAGFHGYDNYRFTVEDTRIYQTTRPYTELDYLLAGGAEQVIKVLHTQNIRPAWNAAFEFRYINSPGRLKNSNVAHGNIRLSTSFATKSKRYSGFALYLTNRNRSTENGGIKSDSFLTSKNSAYDDRFNIPTWLGGDDTYSTNPFSSNFVTRSDYRTRTFFLRHQYDFGQKDSSYTEDSAVIKLFYPRFRLQHTFLFTNNSYEFADENSSNLAYDTNYQQRYGLTVVSPLKMKDTWNDLSNEGAILIFPQKNNQEQFLKAGAGYQMLYGKFGNASERFSNLYLMGEYRNRTRNRKWDVNASGKFYLAGLNSGDYNAAISLQTDFGKKIGSLRVGFQNVNRSPSFVFDTRSSFIVTGNNSFNKENWTILNGDLYVPRVKLHLLGEYFLVSNYTYWDNFYHARQQSTLQNVLHLGGEMTIKLSKRFNWYTELHFQQPTGDDINLPLVYTRNRIAFEGMFYKKMLLSVGIDTRYFTPYKTDDWSAFNGQWVVQNKTTVSNIPDIAAYLHLRIRTLRLYVRAENLNTITFTDGINFNNNNLAAPLYPTPGFIFRLGIYWGFIN